MARTSRKVLEMNYKCGTCGGHLERINDDCKPCLEKEEAEKQRIKEEHEARSK